jgi:alkylation response protein AidB-like acyl-CoA dehydrogenase
VIQHILADMSVGVTSLRNLCISSLEEILGAEIPWRVAATMKSYASRTAQQVAEQTLQIHGGVGFTEQLPLHRYLKRVLTLVGYYGDSKELNNYIGSSLLGTEHGSSPWDGDYGLWGSGDSD